MAEISPTGEKFVIAARVSGAAKTAFPGAPIKTGKINVVVMADSDIFDDRFWVHVQNALGKKIAAPFADNGAFVLNAVENLIGLGRSHHPAHARERASARSPSCARSRQDAQSQFQAEGEGAAAASDRDAAAPARARAGRRARSRARLGLTPRSRPRSSSFRKRPDRHPHPAARRAAQSAQGHRRAWRACSPSSTSRWCRSWSRSSRWCSSGLRRRAARAPWRCGWLR